MLDPMSSSGLEHNLEQLVDISRRAHTGMV